MLARRLARHIFIRKEKPYDLKAALKAVEEKHFNTRYSKEEVRYESARLRMERLQKDPLVQDYIETEKERAQEKQSVLRSYKISKDKAKDQSVDELAQKVDTIIEKLAEAQSRFFQVEDEHEFSKRSLRTMEAARFSKIGVVYPQKGRSTTPILMAPIMTTDDMTSIRADLLI